MRYRLIPLVLPPAALLLAACAGGGGAPPVRPQRDLIRAEEIAASGAPTAFEVIERLRPEYLRGRGTTTVREAPVVSATTPDPVLPQVYVNGVNAGSLEALRGIAATEVREIRFIRAADATTRFGTNHPNGVIEVITR
jgi:hypothetical protein